MICSPVELDSGPYIVYFSSVTENTKRFVDKLGLDNLRLPLRAKDEPADVNRPYILIAPSYGGGQTAPKKAIPLRILDFLKEEKHRDLCVGVISSGNMNFNESFLIAGHLLSGKLNIPMLFGFELAGVPSDVEKCRKGIVDKWSELVQLREKALREEEG